VVAPQFLKLGNPRKVISLLDGVLDQVALDKIELELRNHSAKLYSFSLYHYRFATRQPNIHWRQKVSRLYYASYAASRAIRLYIEGYHSEEVGDHKKIGDLPREFPSNSYFKNNLEVLRVDRNTCDYNHASVANDLALTQKDSTSFVKEFLEETRSYLISKGLNLRGKP